MKNTATGPILITGASSGIGNHLAHYLAERGHPVYATVRKASDRDKLAKAAQITPLQLDVREPDQIQAAYEFIVAQGRGLYGLVNNAGLGGLGMLTTWTDAEILEIFDVNVFGPHRMTNAFVRLLIESQGRIINIGSQGGMITKKYLGPYTMTKFALEAYTEALHQELAPYNVQVSIVQPGGIVTAVGANAMPGIMARFQRAEPPFDQEAQQVLASFNPPPEQGENQNAEAPESDTNRQPSSPEIVSEAVYEALCAATPKRHYLVGTQWEGDRVIDGLLEKLLDENDNPQHRYSRDTLIARLDAQIAKRNKSPE